MTTRTKPRTSDTDDRRGLSPRNLRYMRAFAAAWPDRRIVQEVLAQITWYHCVALLDKVKDPETCFWYARKAREEGWSRNVLVMQIEAKLHERTGKAITNFPAILPDRGFVQRTVAQITWYHCGVFVGRQVLLEVGEHSPRLA